MRRRVMKRMRKVSKENRMKMMKEMRWKKIVVKVNLKMRRRKEIMKKDISRMVKK